MTRYNIVALPFGGVIFYLDMGDINKYYVGVIILVFGRFIHCRKFVFVE